MADGAERRAAIADFIEKAYERIDQADSYYILGVSRDATVMQIRAAYYRLAARLHPDLHGTAMAPELKRKLTTVYSRVVEAYKVLSDGTRRAQYDEGLAKGNVRWDADEGARPKIRRPEDDVSNPGAKKFFLLALDAMRTDNAKSAVMNLRFALSLEPDNERIKAELAKAEERLGDK
jgi:DnaJ-class molecular chaperone